MDGRLVLLLALAALATLHRAIADHIDPPIPCSNAEDCVQFSSTLRDASCKDGFCLCKNSTEIKNCSSADIARHSSRRTGSPMFRECTMNHDCMFNSSFCNTTIRQCECQKGYVFSDNKKTCLKKAEAMDFLCVDKKQCLAYLPNTTCQNGQCNCVPGYHYATNACYRTIDLEKACTRSEECAHVEGAVCTDRKVCDCPAETMIDSKRKRCLPVAREISENCVEDVQCATTFSDSSCIDGSCQCRDRYHFEVEMNRCFVNKGLDENCGNTYECYQTIIDNVTEKAVRCMENVCVCAEDFYRQENRCVSEGTRFFVSHLFVLAMFALAGRA